MGEAPATVFGSVTRTDPRSVCLYAGESPVSLVYGWDEVVEFGESLGAAWVEQDRPNDLLLTVDR